MRDTGEGSLLVDLASRLQVDPASLLPLTRFRGDGAVNFPQLPAPTSRSARPLRTHGRCGVGAELRSRGTSSLEATIVYCDNGRPRHDPT